MRKEQSYLMHLVSKIREPEYVISFIFCHYNLKEAISRSTEDLLDNTIIELFYRAAKKLIENNPKALRRDWVTHLPLELMERAAAKGNKYASICLAYLKHRPTPDNLEERHKTFAKQIQANERELKRDLIKLGDGRVWSKYPPRFENNKEMVLKALEGDTGLYSFNEDLRFHSESQQLLITKIKNGDIGVWNFLPISLQNTDTALQLLKNTPDPDILFDRISAELRDALRNDPRFVLLREDKVREGKLGFYHRLSDQQQQNRDLIEAAVTANPKIYEEMMSQQYAFRRRASKRAAPFIADREIVTKYLLVYPWKVERVLIELGNPPWMKAAIRFAEMILKNDGYLAFTKIANPNIKHFYDFAFNLPLDHQMVLAARAAGSALTVIPPHDVTWASAFILMLREYESVDETRML